MTRDPMVRSIQIGLRGSAEGDSFLLDQDLVLQISDVTRDFQNALQILQMMGDLDQAKKTLWPRTEQEQVMDFSNDNALRDVLQMALPTTTTTSKKCAIVVLGSAANPPHQGHLHCLQVGKEFAEKQLGYQVLFTTIAVAPSGYIQNKMKKVSDSNSYCLSDECHLQALQLLQQQDQGGEHVQCPNRTYGSALHCGKDMRPSDDVLIVIVVGGDWGNPHKWRTEPKTQHGTVVTVCCACQADQLEVLQQAFVQDQNDGLVQNENCHFALDMAGPPTSSTAIRSILWQQEGLEDKKAAALAQHGYSSEASKYLLDISKTLEQLGPQSK